MSWHCSLALVEEFSRLGCSDGESYARLRSTRTAERSSFGAKRRASLSRSPSGTTCEPSTAARGVAAWTSSPAGSPASRSASRVGARPRTTSATSGPRPSGLFARWSPDSRSWRTYRGFSIRYKTRKRARLSQAISGRFLGTWPRAGMTRGGVCFRLLSWERRIRETGCGLWATPRNCTSMAATINPQRATHRFPNLETQVAQAMFPTPAATSYGTNQGGAAGRVGKVRPSLGMMAKQGTWPTPDAQCYRDGTKLRREARESGTRHAVSLHHAVHLWPTPRANTGGPEKTKDATLNSTGVNLATQAGGQLNPTWVEWLMGWPIGWTALEPLGTDKFRQWLKQHGSF